MKRIVLVRHATAVDTGPQGSDFHRGLKKRGKREAAIMAGRLAEMTGTPDLMLSSPADRAMETARIVASRLAYPENRIEIREELYGGLLPEEFLRILQRLPGARRTVMLFGHDPSFTEFAGALAPAFKEAIPKAGVVVIELGDRPWGRIRLGEGKLVAFDRPPEPKVQKRIEVDTLDRLAAAVRQGILRALVEVGVPEVPAVSRTVTGTSDRLAKALRPYAGTPPAKAKGRSRPAGATRKPKAKKAARKTSPARAKSRRRTRP